VKSFVSFSVTQLPDPLPLTLDQVIQNSVDRRPGRNRDITEAARIKSVMSMDHGDLVR